MNARSSSNSALIGRSERIKDGVKKVVKAIIFLAVFGAFIVATYETFFGLRMFMRTMRVLKQI